MPVFVEMVFEFMIPPSWKAVGCGKQYLFWNPDKLLFWICSSDVSELIWKWGAMHLNMTIEKRLQVRLRDWLTILASVVATNVEKSRNAGNPEYFPSYSYYCLKECRKMNLYPFVCLEPDSKLLSLIPHLFYWQRGQTSDAFLTHSWTSWFCTPLP